MQDIVLIDRGEGWRLHGKTGWQNAPAAGIGWWVGWVERDGRVYSFALNMDIRKEEQAGLRLELGKASLKALGMID